MKTSITEPDPADPPTSLPPRLIDHAGLAFVLAVSLAVRLWGLEQSIVENYVGRQIPTAMVARNLDRGSGLLRPRLDVAPLPNAFLVEPPVYAATVVSMRRLSGLPLEASGRVVSAMGTTMAVAGLYGLVAARAGRSAGLISALVLASFPITLRYGRAFQPDALMMGCLVAGLACWDQGVRRSRPTWLVAGLMLVTTGLSLKVISAYLLVPLLFVIGASRRRSTAMLATLTLLPATLWYVYAATEAWEGEGSRASLDNGAIWLGVFHPSALGRSDVWRNVGRFLGVRAFTPLGPVLALVGLAWGGPRRPAAWLWIVWGGATLVAMAALASKLHHEYYWLTLAPVVAAGTSLLLVRLGSAGRAGRVVAFAAALMLLSLDIAFARTTWRTPVEWLSLDAAARVVQAQTAPDDWVAAPEALLYRSDRRGCRVEFTEAAALRAAREWVGRVDQAEVEAVTRPIDLIEFYRRRGAVAFADVTPPARALDRGRVALHEAIRGRYNVVVDRDGVFFAVLGTPTETTRHAALRP